MPPLSIKTVFICLQRLFQTKKKVSLSLSLTLARPPCGWGRGYRFWLRTPASKSCDSSRSTMAQADQLPLSSGRPSNNWRETPNTKVHPPALTGYNIWWRDMFCWPCNHPAIVSQNSRMLIPQTILCIWLPSIHRALLAIEEEFESNRSTHTPPQFFPPSYHLIDFTDWKLKKKEKRRRGEEKRREEKKGG